MEQYTSEDARREWRHILDKIQRGEQVMITRYGEPLALVVPIPEWVIHGPRSEAEELRQRKADEES